MGRGSQTKRRNNNKNKKKIRTTNSSSSNATTTPTTAIGGGNPNSTTKRSSSSSFSAEETSHHHHPSSCSSSSSSLFKRRDSISNSNLAHKFEVRGIYEEYKESTEIFKKWCYNEIDDVFIVKEKGDRRKENNSHPTTTATTTMSLNLLFHRLRNLYEKEILMPNVVLIHLWKAIKLRKEVSKYYTSIPNVTQIDIDSHEWMIQKLQETYKLFRSLQKRQAAVAAEKEDKTEEENDKNGNNQKLRLGSYYSFLDFDADGDDVESLHDDGSQDDNNNNDCDDNYNAARNDGKPMTTTTTMEEKQIRQQEQDEEKTFAIACTFIDIKETRDILRKLWRDYNNKYDDIATKVEFISELVAATSVSTYAVESLRSIVNETSIRLGCNDFFGDMLLMTHKDKNGINNTVINNNNDDDNKEEQTANDENKDDTFVRLRQVYDALMKFDFDSPVVMTCANTDQNLLPRDTDYQPMYTALEVATDKLKLSKDDYLKAYTEGSFDLLLNYFVANDLPLWVSYAYWGGSMGAADDMFRLYLREFHKDREVKLYTAFAIMTVIDCALMTPIDRVQRTAINIIVILDDLRMVLERDGHFDEALEYFGKNECGGDSNMTTNLTYPRLFFGTYAYDRRVLCTFCPWFSGEILFRCLRVNLVASAAILLVFYHKFMLLIHLYWMLRSERLMGRIPEIERALIAMYREKTWFKVGVPRQHYMRSFQLSYGTSIIPGQERRKGTSTRQETKEEGLRPTEISGLLNALQWKTLPVSDRHEAFQYLSNLAREETNLVFLAPLFDVCLKFGRLRNLVYTLCADRASERIPSLHGEPEFVKIVKWAFPLADHLKKKNGGRMPSDTIDFKLLVSCFKKVFSDGVEAVNENEEPELVFSPRDHHVDPSLWDEKGTRESSYNWVKG